MPDRNLGSECIPNVSIGMPVYNAKDFIIGSIDSLIV